MTARVRDALAGRTPVETVSIAGPNMEGGPGYHLVRMGRVVSAVHRLYQGRAGQGRVLYMPADGGWGLLYNLALMACARALDYEVVFHHHSFAYIDRRSCLMNLVVMMGGSKALHVFLSKAMAARFRDRYSRAVRTLAVSNAWITDDQEYAPRPRPRPGAEHGAPLTIGLMSNLSGEKGLHEFIAILKAARDRHLPLRGILAGPAAGAERRAITEAVAELGDALEYLGPVYGNAKDGFLRSIEVFVFPTRYRNEAEPLVLLEALAAGLPVISFGRGCIPEIIDGAGTIIAPDGDFVCEALETLTRWIEDRSKLQQLSGLACERARLLQKKARSEFDVLMNVILGPGEKPPRSK